MTCTFFGHRDCPKEVEEKLHVLITDLIVNKGVTKFYVGNQGKFDFFARRILFQLSKKYSIEYFVVLAYMPNTKENYDEFIVDTIYPDGIEKTPKRLAISFRNRWMIERSDYVITFVIYSWGGASQFKELAEKKGKSIINIKIEG